MEGVNLTKIHESTFVNVTMYPQYNNNMIIQFFKPLVFFEFADYMNECKKLM
jgi:hypothetical protein